MAHFAGLARLLLGSLLLLALLVPSAGARPRSQSHLRSSTHCTTKRTRHSWVRRCRTTRGVGVVALKHGSSTHPPKPASVSAPPQAQAQAPTSARAPATCPDANLVPLAGDVDRVSAATLCLVNQRRSADGEAPLTPDRALTGAAGGHSTDMVDANFFDHASSNGASQAARLLGSGFVSPGKGYTIGENIAWGTGSLATPAAIVSAWIHSPEHHANMLNGAFTKSGIGVVASLPAVLDHSGSAGAVYTEDFGALLG